MGQGLPAVVVLHQHAGQRELGKSEPFGLPATGSRRLRRR
jgi:hypothetical protein